MIPMFKAREQEAQHKFDKLVALKGELNQFKEEMGMPEPKFV